MNTTWGRIFSCLSTTYNVHSLPLDEARKANLAPQPPEPQEKKGLHQRVRRGNFGDRGVEISWPNLRMRISRDYPRSPRDSGQGVVSCCARQTREERRSAAYCRRLQQEGIERCWWAFGPRQATADGRAAVSYTTSSPQGHPVTLFAVGGLCAHCCVSRRRLRGGVGVWRRGIGSRGPGEGDLAGGESTTGGQR